VQESSNSEEEDNLPLDNEKDEIVAKNNAQNLKKIEK
jgi:hypothetical protein